MGLRGSSTNVSKVVAVSLNQDGQEKLSKRRQVDHARELGAMKVAPGTNSSKVAP